MTDARGDRLSRRSVLAGGGLLLVAACTGGGSSPVRVPRLTADQRLARQVADEITVLEAAYAATIAAHPSTAGALSPLAAEHQAHVAALVELLPAPTSTPTASASASGSGSPTASASASPSATPPPVIPTSPAGALRALAVAERAAAARRRGQAGHAGPELARLLASIAACESVHATLVKS
jgi:hypothetical protein